MSNTETETTRGDADFVRIRTINSHVGVSRFYGECADEDIAGWIVFPDGIPSPYAYAKVRPVWHWVPGNAFVLVVETRHKHYEVFSVNPRLVHATEEQAKRIAFGG